MLVYQKVAPEMIDKVKCSRILARFYFSIHLIPHLGVAFISIQLICEQLID